MTPVAWLLVGAGLAFLALLFVLHRARRRLAPRKERALVHARIVRHAPVAPVSPEELAAVPVPVRACPRCGAAAMRGLTMAEGGIPGSSDLLDKQRCARCGHEGLAVVFDRREDYASFVRRLHATFRAERPGR